MDHLHVNHDHKEENREQESHFPLGYLELSGRRLETDHRGFLRLDKGRTLSNYTFATSFLPNHLSPHGISFPSDVFTLVQPELFFGEASVAAGYAFAVKVHEHIDSMIKLVFRWLSERESALNDLVQVPVLELRDIRDNPPASSAKDVPQSR